MAFAGDRMSGVILKYAGVRARRARLPGKLNRVLGRPKLLS